MTNALVRAFSGVRRSSLLWQSVIGLAKKPWKSLVAAKRPDYREEPDDYGPGGFHRINVGDKLDDQRYTVLRKLGYGEYSTVWLAHDLKSHKHVALKVLRSDCYGGKHDIFEVGMLEAISKISGHSRHPGQHHVSRLIGRFDHAGSHGNHVCLVSDVLGPHIGYHTACFNHHMLPIKVVKQVVRQLLLALDFLHQECGINHTDLKPSNILLELEDTEAMIAKYLSKIPPLKIADLVPKKERSSWSSETNATEKPTDIPATEFVSTPLISKMKDIKVRLIDLGVASWVDQHLSDRIQSPFLRAPEVTIGVPWGTGVDIWSLGCLTFEFIRGSPLFAGTDAENGDFRADDHRLALITEWAGPFPKDFLERGQKTKEFFNAEGQLLRIHRAIKQTGLEKVLDGDCPALQRPADLPKTEVPLLVDFLKSVFVIDPEKRRSAAELLEHEWLKD